MLLNLFNVDRIAKPQAGFLRVLPVCMAIGGLIGFVQGALLAAMLKDASISYSLFIGLQGAIVGVPVGGVWGALLVILFFRKTLTNGVFYGVSASSLLLGLLSTLFLHFKVGDAEPISILVIPIASLVLAGFFKAFAQKAV
jgi:hypothetical protein